MQCLIVGAGPVGLTLANLFAQKNINFKIIDRKDGVSKYSKALAVHAKTLELFESLGLSDKLVNNGRKIFRGNIYFDDKKLVTLNLEKIPSKYSYSLSLSQHDTERILEENLQQLGHQVNWNTKFVDLQNYDYIFGCDGAHSTCRKKAGIEFAGGSYEKEFFLADIEVDWDLSPESIYAFFTKDSILATIPLKQENYWRIVTIANKEYLGDRENPTVGDIYNLTKSINFPKFKVKNTIWLSFFHVHHRMVNRYRKGNIFLLGDAAHIHSPVGGQGMNAGMHDAFNLAQKFTAVINEGQDPKLLNQYEEERKPVGKKIVSGTDLATRLVLSRNWLSHSLEKILIPIIMSNDFVKNMVTKNIAMLD